MPTHGLHNLQITMIKVLYALWTPIFFFLLQSAFHDGKQPNWFHQACFFKKHRPASEALIDGFPKLRVEDQKEIRANIGELIYFFSCDQWFDLLKFFESIKIFKSKEVDLLRLFHNQRKEKAKNVQLIRIYPGNSPSWLMTLASNTPSPAEPHALDVI